MGMGKRSVWMYVKPLDFRKQVNGLVEVVMEEMKRRPNDGAIYIFRNRQRDKLKILMWDRNGFVMGYKRLERGKFDIPIRECGPIEMTWRQLMMLVSGMPVLRFGKGAEKEVAFS